MAGGCAAVGGAIVAAQQRKRANASSTLRRLALDGMAGPILVQRRSGGRGKKESEDAEQGSRLLLSLFVPVSVKGVVVETE